VCGGYSVITAISLVGEKLFWFYPVSPGGSGVLVYAKKVTTALWENTTDHEKMQLFYFLERISG
jgi:hypothetical protein